MSRATYAKRVPVTRVQELIEQLGCAHSQASFLINSNGGRLAHSASRITDGDIAAAQQEIARISRTLFEVRRDLQELLP